MKKIAFCFLILEDIHHEDLWFKYFSSVDTRKYTIYIHYKTNNPLKHFEQYKLKNCIETTWGEISIVHAQNLLLKEALKDPKNENIIFVSGSCIPLKHFDYTYAYLNPKKSYFSICPKEQCFPRCDHALTYIDKKYIQKSHQWCILNRKHAQLMLDKQDYLQWFVVCPDEHCYITNLYVHHLEHELILTDTNHVETTFANWDSGGLKNYNSISEDELIKLMTKNYLFGRKFNKGCDLSKLEWTSPFYNFLYGTLMLCLIILLSILLIYCIQYKWKKASDLKLTKS